MLKAPVNSDKDVRALLPLDGDAQKTIYVLDTNVLLHDPEALFQFASHAVCLPLVVLEELDKHKKGSTDLARAARQVSRNLAEMLQHGSMEQGFSLKGSSFVTEESGRLFFHQGAKALPHGEAHHFDQTKADNQILACALDYLNENIPVVLVTNDVNLRVKALALGVPAQDYRKGQSQLADEDVLPCGYLAVDENFWDQELVTSREDGGFWRRGNKQHAQIKQQLPVNSFVIEQRFGAKNRLWRVSQSDLTGSTLVALSASSGAGAAREGAAQARNEQQQMASNLLYDDSIDVVTLLGVAGSGKTLLALAAGIDQVLQGDFKEVLVTRATVPLGDDIGFLPGTEAEKMSAWLGGTLRDAYIALDLQDSAEIQKKVEISSMSFMRGRSFKDKYILVDEAQNLTVHQIRALLTRAGEGCKVVLTGNLSQIDTPYLDETSSGLTWAVKKLQNWRHAGHLILNRGERSRLASFIEEAGASD